MIRDKMKTKKSFPLVETDEHLTNRSILTTKVGNVIIPDMFRFNMSIK